MVSSSFVGFDFGFYFWSQVARGVGSYDLIMRRHLYHLVRVTHPRNFDRPMGIIKKYHCRVRRVLKLDDRDFYIYCSRVGSGLYPASYDTCVALLLPYSRDIRDIRDCCFNCSII